MVNPARVIVRSMNDCETEGRKIFCVVCIVEADWITEMQRE